MKNLLFFILLLAGGYWCYDNYGQNMPVHTTLSHVDGRSMDVVIISRTKTQVNFQRQTDGRRFSCAISQLSLPSKGKVYWHFRPTSQPSNYESTGGQGVVADLHLQGMRAEMEKLSEKIKLSIYEYNAAENAVEQRTISNKIEQLQLEMDQLKFKQATHLSHR